MSDIAAYVFVCIDVCVCMRQCAWACVYVCVCNSTKMSQGFFPPFLITNANVTLMKSA